jgi:error-prone DNA polymerase
MATDEKLLAEYRVLGFSAGRHPLSLLRGRMPPNVVLSDHLPSLNHGSVVEVVGLVVARQRPQTAKGFVFLLIEDEAAMINVIVRPDVFDRHRIAVRVEPFVWIIGKLAKDDGVLNVIADEVRPIRLEASAGRRRGSKIASTGSSLLRNLRQHAPPSKDWG